MDRRSFLKVSALAGGGIALQVLWPASAATNTRHALSVWVSIDSDGIVTLASKNPEIGQGIKTALPMLVAEELDCDWSRVHVEQSPLNPAVYGPQRAGGSMATPLHWLPLRQAGAVARQMLLTAAAVRANVPVAELDTESGLVLHRPSGRRWTYGELAAEAARQVPPDPTTVKLKSPDRFRLVGRPQRGVDTPKIVRGEPLFGIDVRLPGMLHAVFESAPAHGGRLVRANLEAARAVPGVVAVLTLEGNGGPDALVDGVAIVAHGHWQAEQARRRLDIVWDLSAARGHGSADYAAQARQWFDAPGDGTGMDLRVDGDVDATLSTASRRLTARYDYPFLAHAPLEPQNTTAVYRDGHLEVWTPSQNAQSGVGLIAQHLGIPADRQTVHYTRSGGGFGRRLMCDYMVQAAAIAKALPGRPVQLLWSREEDFKRDFFRPAGWHELEAGLDASGRLIALRDRFVTFGKDGKTARGAGLDPQHFPAGLLDHLHYRQHLLPTVIPTGFLRAPSSNALCFVFQGFLDEVAVASGRDLPTLMLELCAADRIIGSAGDPSRASPAFHTTRARAVIRRVLADSRWHERRSGQGHGFGFAFYFCHLGYFAEVAEVRIDAGTIQVPHVWVAGDIGSQIINPLGADQQVRGSVLEGLAQALLQRIDLRDGTVEQSGFSGYPLPRIGTMPEVHVSFVPSDFPPSGLGEPALPPVIPAIANAVHAATGQRLRSLPLRLA